MSQQATIFALSSAPGRAGVAVVRISGPAAAAVVEAMAAPCPRARRASLRQLRHPRTGEALDEALVLWLPGPGSFTGEDMAELHVHGGRAVVQGVLAALGELPGLRLAEPGEFARRAFENGRIDLTRAEGLADLVDAETEAQRIQALRQAGGGLAALYEGWRGRLVEALAEVEAGIDFSDEADVGAAGLAQGRAAAAELVRAIASHLDDGRRGEILRDGFQVALVGAPNVGKSSLLNALAQREAAIVSEEAGTTRDVIEVRLDLAGYPVIVSDTAGLREPAGAVEREGVRRTLERARAADLVVWVADATAPLPPPADLAASEDRLVRIANKVDLCPRGAAPDAAHGLAVSAVTGAGIGTLIERLAGMARQRIGSLEHPAITAVRHRIHLETCLRALRSFLAGSELQAELRAEDLRQAANALGRLTGRIDAEQVLDHIFSRFCIGK